MAIIGECAMRGVKVVAVCNLTSKSCTQELKPQSKSNALLELYGGLLKDNTTLVHDVV